MTEPVWIDSAACHAFHCELLERFGGIEGVRDQGLLESALGRPKHLFAYGKPSLYEMAATYAGEIIKNHPFLDGNKRTGFLAAALFLEINGRAFRATEEDVVERTLAFAAGAISEDDYCSWLETSSAEKE